MTGYLGSLIRRTGLAVTSSDPGPSTTPVGGEAPAVTDIVEDTVETVSAPPVPGVDPAPPRPPVSERHQELPGPFRTRVPDLTAPVDDERDIRRADAAPDAEVSGPTRIEERVHATPSAVPALEQTEVREIRAPAQPAPEGNRDPGAPPASAFERAQVWHTTYRSVREWVAAPVSADEMAAAMERHDVVEAPVARTPIIRAGMAPPPAAVEQPWHDPPAVPELHVSIGTISVVVEEPAVTPPTAKPVRPPRPAPSDWTRLRRRYVR